MTDRIPTQDITDAAQKKAAALRAAKGRKEEKKQDTESLYQKRQQIYVRKAIGFFTNLRTSMNWVLLLAYFSFSWIQWNGKQAILFDLPNRQFHIFDITFFPHDFMLLSWVLIICAFLLFFMTVFAGRVWCGYTCPQSVWTFLYIWAERVTEGPRNKRMSLDRSELTKEKVARKGAKHLLWLFFAAATAFAFVGYFSPVRDLGPRILEGDLGPWESWWLIFFVAATYINAGWLREQVCIYMCPYARFQSVMFDQDTLIISYDEQRGENRGKRKKGSDYKAQGLGDCIDCNACVHVCPVGIDIRDGLQYECVACGACVDACDDMMERVGYPKGLVLYTTEHQLDGNKTHIMRPRLIGYFAVLCAMFIAFAYTLYSRIPLEVDILRDRGQLFSELPNGNIENVYTLKLANKEQVDHDYSISVSGIDGMEYKGADVVTIKSGELLDLPVRITVAPRYLSKANNTILFKVEALDNQSISIEEENRFIGPAPKR
jgi:cytochrome c oxidase accessory protein FixG